MAADIDAGAVAAPSTPAQDTDARREVKVRLPMEQVLRLHATRLRSRRNVSDIVSSALSRYFSDLQAP